jgi:glycosyltransferase involved in cell wall biosynthesis
MNEIAVSPPEDREICYVCHEKNAGGAAARNTGAAAARGQYVAFLDDDDSWKPEKTRRQVNLFQASPEPLGLVYTGVRIVHGNGELHRYRAAAYRGYIRDALAIHNVVGTTSSVLIPRHVFHEVGGFDPGFPARQDLDLWFRISQRWPVDYVDEELTIQYRHEEERITHGVDRKLQARQIFLEKYRDFFSNRRRLLAEYHFRTGRYCLQQGQTGQARGYLLRSLGCAPSASALKRLVGSFMVRGNRSGQDADNSTDDV